MKVRINRGDGGRIQSQTMPDLYCAQCGNSVENIRQGDKSKYEFTDLYRRWEIILTVNSTILKDV